MAADTLARAIAIAPPPSAIIAYQPELDAARDYAAQEKAASTRACYARDWAQFTTWCREMDAEPLPATPETVAAYLAHLAKARLKAASIARKTAAIRYAHRLANYESPTTAETVKAVSRGIRHTHGTAPDRKRPVTAAVLMAMLRLCPDTLAGKRDRALLALGFAGAFRRSELVALEVVLIPRPFDVLNNDGFVVDRHGLTRSRTCCSTLTIMRLMTSSAG
jgi:site-specific recombinase XerD